MKERFSSLRCVLRKTPWVDRNQTNITCGALCFVDTPVAFYIPTVDWPVLMAVCKCWLAELTGLEKLKHWTRRGLGKARAVVWEMLLCTNKIRAAGKELPVYKESIKNPCVMDGDIRRDIGRTFPENPHFKDTHSQGQQALHRVLRAVSHRLNDVGYCQGMNFVAGTMIRVLPEEVAYEAMVYLMVFYRLECFFLPHFPRLQVMLFQLDRLVEAFLPKLHNSFQKYNLSAEFYAVQWFLTLLTYDLPHNLVLRVWDMFLLYGWKVIFRVSLALLYMYQETLCALDFDDCLRQLKVFTKDIVNWDYNKFLATANSFKVSNRMLSALARAYQHTGGGILFVLKDLDSGRVGWEVVEEKVYLQGATFGHRIPMDMPSTYLDCDVSPQQYVQSQNPFACLLPNRSMAVASPEKKPSGVLLFGSSIHAAPSRIANRFTGYVTPKPQISLRKKTNRKNIHKTFYYSSESSVYYDELDDAQNLLIQSERTVKKNGSHKNRTSITSKVHPVVKPKGEKVKVKIEPLRTKPVSHESSWNSVDETSEKKNYKDIPVIKSLDLTIRCRSVNIPPKNNEFRVRRNVGPSTTK